MLQRNSLSKGRLQPQGAGCKEGSFTLTGRQRGRGRPERLQHEGWGMEELTDDAHTWARWDLELLEQCEVV